MLVRNPHSNSFSYRLTFVRRSSQPRKAHCENNSYKDGGEYVSSLFVCATLSFSSVSFRGPINIVACENLHNATGELREAIEKELNDQEHRYTQDHVGFAVCSVDRIVPPFSSDHILDVGVEPFYEWTVDLKSLKKTDPDVNIKGMHSEYIDHDIQ